MIRGVNVVLWKWRKEKLKYFLCLHASCHWVSAVARDNPGRMERERLGEATWGSLASNDDAVIYTVSYGFTTPFLIPCTEILSILGADSKAWSTQEKHKWCMHKKNERAGKNGEKLEVERSQREIIFALTDHMDNDPYMSIILNKLVIWGTWLLGLQRTIIVIIHLPVIFLINW